MDDRQSWARRWIAIAKDDFELAQRALRPPALADLACFHSQQAVEKALKGLLAFLGAKTIPRVHDLGGIGRACGCCWGR
ncbi:MAG: HEPN domain-containing protein [Armatimonadetes bacterium]|nr:HEPN domain-containing protein [Armatimonadota bacterium]